MIEVFFVSVHTLLCTIGACLNTPKVPCICPAGATVEDPAVQEACIHFTILTVLSSICRYVVDAGRAKMKRLEVTTSTHRFPVQWVSQASADQRAGRAGRTGPGHCYRLYSSAVFKDLFPDHTPAEILNTALDGVVLSMHAMGLPKVQSP